MCFLMRERDESDVTACDAFILFTMKIIVKCLVFYQLCMQLSKSLIISLEKIKISTSFISAVLNPRIEQFLLSTASILSSPSVKQL